MNRKYIFISLLLSTSFFSTQLLADKERVYTIGVVPQFEIRHIRKIWNPILREIEKKTGYKIKLVGSPTIPDFSKEIKEGRFDFAYMNPLQTVTSNVVQGYVPIVRDKQGKLQGILVVRKDSDIISIKDLEGKKVAFPSPNALGASLLLRAILLTDHNVNINPVYVKTHSSVYLNTIVKQVVAGGGVQKTLDQQKEEIKNLLRVLYHSPKVVSHSISAHPRVPKKVTEAIKNALLHIGNTDVGKALLSKIPIMRIGEAKLKDYDKLKKMQLERFYAK